MKKTLDNNSKFSIYASFTLSLDDINTMSLLYAPLIGSDAFMLYFGLYSLIERNNMKSETIIHQDFLEIFSFKTNDFLNARLKLEGIGLLISYATGDGSYLYYLCPPLTAKSFIKDATLGLFLYSKIRRETFDFIYNHFAIERIDTKMVTNITKSFDEVYDSSITNDSTYEKFGYILGRNPNQGLVITNNKFDFNKFKSAINTDFLELGITKEFTKQIEDLAFVYKFNENEMIGLYNDSINKQGLFDYRLLKQKANQLFVFNRNLKAPILTTKSEDDFDDIVTYLDNVSPVDLLDANLNSYPPEYLDTINQIYSEINLPRGVLNCMIIKVLKSKGGVLPKVNYFKSVAETWIGDNILSTQDAIEYTTTMKSDRDSDKKDKDDNGGFRKL
jgi:replication initiation and membrane attachment protein